MGIQDRDYWKDRYNKSESASRPNTMDPQYWQREKPFSGARQEMSFVAKLVITIVLLLIAALAYRYQAQIVRLLRPETSTPKPLDVAIQSPAVVPKSATAGDAQSASVNPPPSAQIYRCGSSYSHSPCPNGQQLEVPVNQHRDMSATREIYLCKDHYDRMTWESVPCSANGVPVSGRTGELAGFAGTHWWRWLHHGLDTRATAPGSRSAIQNRLLNRGVVVSGRIERS